MEPVYVVAVLMVNQNGVKSTTTFTQHWSRGGTKNDAIVRSLERAQKLKPGFSIHEWLVTEVTPEMHEGMPDAG